MFGSKKRGLPSAAEALPGRQERMLVPETHFVTGARLEPPFPAGTERAGFGMGRFWGEEERFWGSPGVCSTSVGYAGGHTPNPTYEGAFIGGADRARRALRLAQPRERGLH